MVTFIQNFQNTQMYTVRKYVSDCLELGVGLRIDGRFDNQYCFFLGWWNVLKLIVLVVAQFCEYVKNHWTEHLREGRILKQNKTHKRLLCCEQPYAETCVVREQDFPIAIWVSLEANSFFLPFIQSQAFRWSHNPASSFDCSLVTDHEPEVPILAV